MFTIQVTTPPASEPVSTATLKTSLRLNTTAEDSLLPGYITTARQQFEHSTQRAVMTTVFRQYVQGIAHTHHHGHNPTIYPLWRSRHSQYPTIWLMRGDVQSVQDVNYYDATTGSATASTTHTVDLIGNPSRVYWANGLPNITQTLPHIAYVDFTAGWTSVPADVCTAITLLAGHYYEQRTAYLTDNLKELPQGFCSIAAKYSLNLTGTWGL